MQQVNLPQKASSVVYACNIKQPRLLYLLAYSPQDSFVSSFHITYISSTFIIISHNKLVICIPSVTQSLQINISVSQLTHLNLYGIKGKMGCSTNFPYLYSTKTLSVIRLSWIQSVSCNTYINRIDNPCINLVSSLVVLLSRELKKNK